MSESIATVRLWIHNELTDANEECIVFNVTFLSGFESDLAQC